MTGPLPKTAIVAAGEKIEIGDITIVALPQGAAVWFPERYDSALDCWYPQTFHRDWRLRSHMPRARRWRHFGCWFVPGVMAAKRLQVGAHEELAEQLVRERQALRARADAEWSAAAPEPRP